MSISIPEEVIPKKPGRVSSKAAYYAQVPESVLARKSLRSTRLQEKVVFEFSTDPGLIHQYCSMRENMFISVWGLKHFSGVKDRFDDTSYLMVARKGLLVIGGGRLTVSTAAQRMAMPLEGPDFVLADVFPELDLKSHTYGEFSRLAILPEYRAGNVFPELAKRFISKAVAEGVDFAFNMAPLPLARSYRQAMQMFGMSWKICNHIVVPDREEYEGIKMAISIMDLRPLRFGFKPEANESWEIPVLAD